MRVLQILSRTVHVTAMALVLGGLAFDAPPERFLLPLLLTTASGVVLFAIELYRSFAFLYQGAGVATLLKLLMLGLASALPTLRFELYLSATLLASLGSHMNYYWRHFSLLHMRVQGGCDMPRRKG